MVRLKYEAFEGWAIAVQDLAIFNSALSAAAHDAFEAFTPLFSSALEMLPMDNPDHESNGAPAVFLRAAPTPEAIAKVRELVATYERGLADLQCYVFDLVVESQNVLLVGLFARAVPARVPRDPSHKVVTARLEDRADLEAYFASTAWGRATHRIEDEVRRKVSAPEKPGS
jgi:hypothetical protein